MANIDISSKVDTSADNYLLVQEKIKDQDFSIEVMYQMIEMLIGEKALKEIKEMKLTIPGLKAVIIALSAVVNEVEYEEMEKRFQ